MEPLLLNISELNPWLNQFFWPLIRISAMFVITPVIGSSRVPLRIRVALSVFITLMIVPVLPPVENIDPISADGMVMILQQLLIGFGMGLILLFVFTAISLAGETIAMSMGLGFAIMSDPQNGRQVPVLGQFFWVISGLLFLALNGHLALIQMIVTSFEYIPISTTGMGNEGIWTIINWSSIIFSLALRVALPAVFALLTINIAMGVMTRAAPQLNIFSVGFPITMLAGFIAILLTLPNLAPLFEQSLEAVFVTITTMLGGTS